MPFATVCGELSLRVVELLKCQYGLEWVGRECHLLLVEWLVEGMDLEQYKVEPFIFRKMVDDRLH